MLALRTQTLEEWLQIHKEEKGPTCLKPETEESS